MRYSAQMYERKRLECRGISQVRSQFDSDTTRPNSLLNFVCFALPLLLGTTVYFRASLDARGTVIFFSGVAILMSMAIFAVLRPKRVVGQAFVFGLFSMALLLMIFIGTTPPDHLRQFFHLPS